VLHILIIDDDIDLCLLLQEGLQAEVYSVSVATDGAQGIALQRKQRASLLITDIFMPNKEGIETIRDRLHGAENGGQRHRPPGRAMRERKFLDANATV
jgi:DNA-binding response OmpR family regulator